MNVRHCTCLGEVCFEIELSDHIGKCLALTFISALSIHLQYITDSALPQSYFEYTGESSG